jgi:hypothetical protein
MELLSVRIDCPYGRGEGDGMSLSAARSRLMFARENLNMNRTDEVEPLVAAAEEFLAQVHDEEDAAAKAALLQEIAEVRAEVAAMPTADERRHVSAAQGKIRLARNQIEHNYMPDYIAESLEAALQALADVRDEFRKPLLIEVDDVRALLGGTGTPDPEPEPEVVTGERTDEAQERVARAQGQLRWARSSLESRRYDEVERNVQQALDQVTGVADAHKADLLREIDQIRAEANAAAAAQERDALISRATGQLRNLRSDAENGGRVEQVGYQLERVRDMLAEVPDEHKADLLRELEEIRTLAEQVEQTERFRALERTLDAQLSLADSCKEDDFGEAREALARFHERMERDDVAGLPDATKERLRVRATELAAEVAANLKADALGRAESRMRDIAGVLDDDPFAGRPDDEVYRTATTLEHYRNQVVDYLRRIPEPDADVQAARDRLAALDAKLAHYNDVWAEAAAEARVSSHWAGSAQSIEGWADEPIDAAPPSMYAPSVARTRAALVEAMRFRADADVLRIRDEYPGNEAIRSVWQASGDVLEASAAKVNAAFVRSLEHAEAMPSPMLEADITNTMHLAAAAGTMLDGTPYKVQILDRIEALETRWRHDYAETLDARRRLYDALAAEADAKWPEMVAASGATTSFDPWNPVTGQTIVLSGVRNRCGWEWSGPEYGFAMKHQAVVLGGVWEPHVLRALEHAWYELKLDVNDRIPGDVIAVVQGRSTIGERTQRVIRDANSGAELGTVEEWPSVDCVLLRIVGLHAGPVAVGPGENPGDS